MTAPPAEASEQGFREAFERFDADHDGLLTPDEMESSLRHMGHVIDADELRRATGGPIDYATFRTVAERSRPDPVRQAWDLFDADHDGRVTLEELKLALVKLGEFLPPGEAERMLDSVDADRDGTLSFEEFRAMMTAQQQQ